MPGRSAAGGALPLPLTAGPIFARNLSIGISGDDVSVLQRSLIAGGFLKIPVPTGYFGPLTKSALSAWQARSGISPATGYFGPVSRAEISAPVSQAPIIPVPVQTTAGTTSVAVADSVVRSLARFEIPKLNVSAGFQYNGLKSGGTIEIPDNLVDVGWFTGSALPGEKGTAIVMGHVAQVRGGIITKPGVFSGLSELQPGDEIYVRNDKGEAIRFVVRESRYYDPAAAAADVFIAKDDGAHLNLITCEGVWDAVRKSYSQRLVVFTDLQ